VFSQGEGRHRFMYTRELLREFSRQSTLFERKMLSFFLLFIVPIVFQVFLLYIFLELYWTIGIAYQR